MSLMALQLRIKSSTGKNKMNDTQLSFVRCATGDSI